MPSRHSNLIAFFIALFLLQSVFLLASDRSGVGTSREPAVAGSYRQAAKTLKLDSPILKQAACLVGMDEECRMEGCSKFYGLLSVMFVMASPNAWNTTRPHEITWEPTDYLCVPLPKELWVGPQNASLNKLYWECAKDANGQTTKLPKDSCPNPEFIYGDVFMALDPESCFKDFAPEYCKKIDPTKEIATCIKTGTNLAGFSQACGENCCKK